MLESRSCLLLVPRCYGFGTVLDSSDGWFQGESPADRLPGRPCAELEGELREQEERARAHWRLAFKLSGFGPAHRRLVESECPYGAEPHPCLVSGARPMSSDISFIS